MSRKPAADGKFYDPRWNKYAGFNLVIGGACRISFREEDKHAGQPRGWYWHIPNAPIPEIGPFTSSHAALRDAEERISGTWDKYR